MSNNTSVYSEDFYATQKNKSYSSAQFIVPIIIEIVHPKTVIDIGCGVGTWLSVFKKYGSKIIGLDGEYVNKKMLLISREDFQSIDLNNPIEMEKKLAVFRSKDSEKYFDLAISLEVAEHLDQSRATGFVHELTELSDAILFSAAVPGQGGYNHINEKEMAYWVDLFMNEGYIPISCIRPLFNDIQTMKELKEVGGDYANNICLYINKTKIERYNISNYSYEDDYQQLPFMKKYVSEGQLARRLYYSIKPNRVLNNIASIYKSIR